MASELRVQHKWILSVKTQTLMYFGARHARYDKLRHQLQAQQNFSHCDITNWSRQGHLLQEHIVAGRIRESCQVGLCQYVVESKRKRGLFKQ